MQLSATGPLRYIIVLVVGIGPTTFGFEDHRSTIELYEQKPSHYREGKNIKFMMQEILIVLT